MWSHRAAPAGRRRRYGCKCITRVMARWLGIRSLPSSDGPTRGVLDEKRGRKSLGSKRPGPVYIYPPKRDGQLLTAKQLQMQTTGAFWRIIRTEGKLQGLPEGRPNRKSLSYPNMEGVLVARPTRLNQTRDEESKQSPLLLMDRQVYAYNTLALKVGRKRSNPESRQPCTCHLKLAITTGYVASLFGKTLLTKSN